MREPVARLAGLVAAAGDTDAVPAARVATFGEERAPAPEAVVADLGAVATAIGGDASAVAELAGPAAGAPAGGAPAGGAPAGGAAVGEVAAGAADADQVAVGGGRSPAGGSRGRRRGGPAQLDPDADPLVVAREVCLRLLGERARTRQELAQALRRKGVPDEAAEAVLGRFGEVGLIDDAAFADQWVRSRHRHRGLARRALAVELRRKGVADDVAGEALAEIDSASEEEQARRLVEKKLRSMAVATAQQQVVAARRLVGMLARRGYGAGIAYPVVKAALAAHGAELD